MVQQSPHAVRDEWHAVPFVLVHARALVTGPVVGRVALVDPRGEDFAVFDLEPAPDLPTQRAFVAGAGSRDARLGDQAQTSPHALPSHPAVFAGFHGQQQAAFLLDFLHHLVHQRRAVGLPAHVDTGRTVVPPPGFLDERLRLREPSFAGAGDHVEVGRPLESQAVLAEHAFGNLLVSACDQAMVARGIGGLAREFIFVVDVREIRGGPWCDPICEIVGCPCIAWGAPCFISAAERDAADV